MSTNIFYDVNNRTIESGKNAIYNGELYMVLEDKVKGLILHPVLRNVHGNDVLVADVYKSIQLL